MVTSDDDPDDLPTAAPKCVATRHSLGVSYTLRNCQLVTHFIARLGITTPVASGAEDSARIRDSGLLALMTLSLSISRRNHHDHADDADLGPNAAEHVPSEETASDFLGRLESLLRSCHATRHYSALVLLPLRGVELSLSAPSSLGQDKLSTADATRGAA